MFKAKDDAGYFMYHSKMCCKFASFSFVAFVQYRLPVVYILLTAESARPLCGDASTVSFSVPPNACMYTRQFCLVKTIPDKHGCISRTIKAFIRVQSLSQSFLL